ncbi:helix-turn-helix transcriptional regulator [Paraburkholderia tropica]|uniref:helix-turn-helix transcriptional regulator n=1 Tax=Paraburkholderia tropica TaxID=92647 RepID=UPI0038CD83E9
MPPLSEILAQLRLNPADGRSLAELAQNFSIGERTLMRMCRRDLGVSLTEWRQRLRTIHALPLLRSGKTVEIVARELGYGSASAFIATFRRIIGVSPGKFCVSVKDR